MSKTARTCPFSEKACVECAVYRGRHLYLAIEKECCKSQRNISRNAAIMIRKARGNTDESPRRLGHVLSKPITISNVEDLIEAEEFLRFGEKRRES